MTTTTDTAPVSDQVYRDRATALANMLAARPERHDQEIYGAIQPANECGTVACVAGWSALAMHNRISIAPDGTMTWGELRQDRHGGTSVNTLYDPAITMYAFSDGSEWLGLSRGAARALFYGSSETTAVEVLRRLGDGRLTRDFTSADVDDVWYEVNGDDPLNV